MTKDLTKKRKFSFLPDQNGCMWHVFPQEDAPFQLPLVQFNFLQKQSNNWMVKIFVLN